MNDFDVTVFGNVADIDNAIKELRDRRKELKANEVKANREAAKAEKAKALAEAKANLEGLGLEEGTDVRFILKGEETEGSFVKVTEARFVVLVDGEKKTLLFDKFLSVVE
jgi:hypothetical protein